MAWYSPESRIEMRRKGAMTAKKACQGMKLSNVVNKDFLETKNSTLLDTFNYM